VAPRKIVLASRSPQRQELLSALGLQFEIADPAIEELTEGDPREIVLENARWKAAAVAATAKPGTVVIAGDTEVAIGGEVLGQPENEAQARRHLDRLSGRDHEVIGGLALLGLGEPRDGIEASTVTFRKLAPVLLEVYLSSREWEGRAGSYAIQGLGSTLVAGVRGDVSNVIGLPIPLLIRLAPELFQAG
jgi:septum formation protein